MPAGKKREEIRQLSHRSQKESWKITGGKGRYILRHLSKKRKGGEKNSLDFFGRPGGRKGKVRKDKEE